MIVFYYGRHCDTINIKKMQTHTQQKLTKYENDQN